MNIFANLKVYAGKWSVKESRNFTSEEKAQVAQAIVVPSQYGNSVQFTMKGGGLTFIPLSDSATLSIGESVDLDKAKVITLSKSGELDIYRIEI